jgi:hypothetical protein
MMESRSLLPILVLPIATQHAIADCVTSPSNLSAFSSLDSNYEVVLEQKAWMEAAACASSRGGRLVHIESASEQSLILSQLLATAGLDPTYESVADGGNVAYVWIGATDQVSEDTWIWDGDDDKSGPTFWVGSGLLGSGNGAIVDDSFHNWGGSDFWGGLSGLSTSEPDDAGGQDAAAIALADWPIGSDAPIGIRGEWNDISTDNALYFVIEYELDTDRDGLVNRLDDDDDNDGFSDAIELAQGTNPIDARDNPGIRSILTSVLPILLEE